MGVCAYAHLWEAKQLHAGAKEWSAHCKSAVVNLAVAMLKHEHPEKWEALAKPLEVLATLRPPVKGVVLSTPGVVEVPPMLRSRVVALLEVSMRVLGYKEPVENGEQIGKLLETHPLLKEALSSSVWFEEDGKTLREEFKPKKGGKQKK